MKRILLILLAVCMIAALAACGPSREEMAEAQAEQQLEQMLGDDVDVDIDDGGDSVSITSDDGDINIDIDESGDSATITGEDGEVVIEGGGQAWPSGDLPAYVPEVEGVKVVGTMQSGPSVIVTFENCSADVANSYKGKMEAAGWNITLEVTADGTYNVMGQMGDNEFLQFTWDSDDEQGGITYGKS